MDSSDMMVKEERIEDYGEDEDMEHVDVVADEVTIGSDRQNMFHMDAASEQEATIVINQKVHQIGPLIPSNRQSGPVKVIRLPKGFSSFNQSGQNKPIRIITLPSKSLGGASSGIRKVPVIQSGGVNDTQVVRPTGGIVKLATADGRIIHVRTGGQMTAPKRTFIVSRNAQGGVRRAIMTPVVGSQAGATLIRSSPVIARRSESGQLVWPAEPQLIGGSGGQGRLALARALTTASLADRILDQGDSGDEANSAYAQALKSNGLRKYAQSVCQKVKEKGITSYNEVADELVQEYAAENPMIPQDQLQYHQKNIRRRVYDALNVLMAMQIITKEKKEIRWVGLPVNAMQERKRLEIERDRRMACFRAKVQQIEELIMQLISYKTLIARNRMQEKMSGRPNENAVIQLPFITVTTQRKSVINCNISDDKLEYSFTFDQPFELRDDKETLRAMGLNLDLGSELCSEDEYQQCLEMVPPALRFYVEALYERRPAIEPDLEAVHQQRRHYLEAKLAAAASGGMMANRPLSHHHTQATLRLHQGGFGRDLDDEDHETMDDLEVDEEVDPSDEDQDCTDDEDAELDVG